MGALSIVWQRATEIIEGKEKLIIKSQGKNKEMRAAHEQNKRWIPRQSGTYKNFEYEFGDCIAYMFTRLGGCRIM